MSRKCSVCIHPQSSMINILLINGATLRDIAGQFDVKRAALHRHYKNHIPELLASTKEKKGEDLLREVNKLWLDEQKLLSAIQAELVDPLKPGSYCLSHKPEDLRILYIDRLGKNRRVKLSTLLKRLEKTKTGVGEVDEIQSKLNPIAEFHKAQIVLKGLIELKIEMSVLQKLKKLEEISEQYEKERRNLLS